MSAICPPTGSIKLTELPECHALKDQAAGARFASAGGQSSQPVCANSVEQPVQHAVFAAQGPQPRCTSSD
jgi:hypothetical protein